MYTPQDLDRAREELFQIQERSANYSGNNPNKYQADIKTASKQVRDIEQDLKTAGDISSSEHEQIEQKLDCLHPNAQSKEIVEHNGRRYQRWFSPLKRSRSGKSVTEWSRSWVDVTDDAP